MTSIKYCLLFHQQEVKKTRLLRSKLLAKPGYESRTFKIQATELLLLNTKKMAGKPF